MGRFATTYRPIGRLTKGAENIPLYRIRSHRHPPASPQFHSVSHTLRNELISHRQYHFRQGGRSNQDRADSGIEFPGSEIACRRPKILPSVDISQRSPGILVVRNNARRPQLGESVYRLSIFRRPPALFYHSFAQFLPH
jgi:hypothetical protein